MNIQTVIPTTPPPAPSTPTPDANLPQAPVRKLHDAVGGFAEHAEVPRVSHTRAELQFDETLNRVVGRIVDEETGEAIHEIPPKGLKALYTKMREQLGPLVDETA